MNWLDRIFGRDSTAHGDASTSYGETIQRLAAAEDATERKRLARLLAVQLQGAMGASANNAQVAIWTIEQQLTETLREQLGATNDMISMLAQDARRDRDATLGLVQKVVTANTAALEGLSQTTEAGFRRVDTRLEEVGTAVDELRTGQTRLTQRADEHDRGLANLTREVATFARFRDEVQALIAANPPLPEGEREDILTWVREKMKQDREASDAAD